MKKKKLKKGFTLIELLAVIVILSIIITITTYSVGNILNNSRISLSSTQKKIIEKAAEEYYIKEGMDNDSSCVNLSYLIEKGYIESNKVKNPANDTQMNGSVEITYNSNRYNYQYKETVCKQYVNGEVVYFNVTTGNACSESDYNSNIERLGNTGCLKFYTFNDSEISDKVNLLLDHTTTVLVAWNLSENNVSGPTTLLTQLQSDTSNWKGTQPPTNYTGIGCSEYDEDEDTCITTSTYTIDYSNYKARLITAEEIAQITGYSNWTTNGNFFYFDTNTTSPSDTCKLGDTTGCNYGWLYDRTSGACTDYGCLNNSTSDLYGYWTASAYYNDFSSAWIVKCYAHLEFVSSNDSGRCGLRPVITVLKSAL